MSITPKAGEEYEVTFDMARGICTTSLQRLTRSGGKDVRIPQPIFENGMPSCAGKSPIFGKVIPDTPHRTALINAIVETHMQLITLMEPDTAQRPQAVEEAIAERKARFGQFTPPEAYWTQYRENYARVNQEMAGRKARTLELYERVYRMRLSGTEDAILEQWQNPTDAAVVERVKANDKLMAQYYKNTSKAVMVDIVNHHMERMSQLDQRFDVCAHDDQCWRL